MSGGNVFEVSRENQGLDFGTEASIADSDAADILGFDDFGIAHGGWEVPTDFAPVSQRILFQPGHQERVWYQLEWTIGSSFGASVLDWVVFDQ